MTSQPTASSNPYFWQFAKSIQPDEWTSKQARDLYQAAVEAEKAGDDVKNALFGSVRVAYRPIPGSEYSTYGWPAKLAEEKVLTKIDALRREAKRLEQILTAYGAAAFIQRSEPLPAPSHPFGAEETLLEIINLDVSRIWIHGVEFRRGLDKFLKVND